MLRLAHLSDIHFSNHASKIGFNPDRDVRSELKRDLADQVKKRGPLDAILVTGDIAFAGKREEYQDAAAWLDELCDAGECSRSSVFVCTGNHDIDQAVLKANSAIQDMHDAIRRGPTHYDRDSALMRRLEQPEVRNLLYAPLREYNEFAARYECSFFGGNESFAWDRDLQLNDGSILRIRGLNSALLSGLSDREKSLFLGTNAWTMPRHDGVEYLCMSHHPPNWLQDGREFEVGLDRARIQLFGHEHDQRITPARDYVRLYAGSVNPHRSEPSWQPGYNILEISIETGDGVRNMVVDAHVRVWRGPPPLFRNHDDKDGTPYHRTVIKLADWSPPSAWRPEPVVSQEEPTVPSPPGESTKPATTMTVRELVHRFFRLSLSQKTEIVGRLDLAKEEDNALPDVERYKLALLRAKEANQLNDVGELIEEMEKRG
ncbi:metallophosphoesterase [Caulobacter sp. BP25]|uniref:metallophosphoesterase n=1 Tax=Caulobacter sp. BP25 TaxID=2048900 RepID=UPI000C12D978|nr:metallophosphoesterase [Caulobacter sp. BP25]PHY21508.1 metallophosphoesterase [Caulobacter sp. BP25]